MPYTIDDFLNQCNISPIFKEYRKKHGNFTKTDLKKVGFVKNDYYVEELPVLKNLLYEFRPPEEPKTLNKVFRAERATKDLRHQWLIKNFSNQKLVMQARKQIDMPFENRGFLIKDKNLKGKTELFENYTNRNFSFSPEFKDWFFRNSKDRKDYDEWEKASSLNWEVISLTINKIMKKWELPVRYEKAIRELILFNRIIPASSGISWMSVRKGIDGEWQETIVYDADTTKKELIAAINQDEYGIFKRRKKYLQGKSVSVKRKMSETKTMMDYYNQRKKDSKKDKDIFQEISRRYGISISAARKRLTGK